MKAQWIDYYAVNHRVRVCIQLISTFLDSLLGSVASWLYVSDVTSTKAKQRNYPLTQPLTESLFHDKMSSTVGLLKASIFIDTNQSIIRMKSYNGLCKLHITTNVI